MQKYEENWIDSNIPATLPSVYFSLLFYILHKLISLAILVLRQFRRRSVLLKKLRDRPADQIKSQDLIFSGKTYN